MLKQGQIIRFTKVDLAKVLFVNESRAHVKILSKQKKSFTTACGQAVNFISCGKEVDISPNSEVEVVKN